MRITQEAENAIQIVYYLAHNSKRSGAVEISEGTTAPLRFTKKYPAEAGLLRAYKIVPWEPWRLRARQAAGRDQPV